MAKPKSKAGLAMGLTVRYFPRLRERRSLGAGNCRFKGWSLSRDEPQAGESPSRFHEVSVA